MQPLLNPGYKYDNPKPFTWEKIAPGDAKYSSVPIMGKPPSPPPSENVVPPGESDNKAEVSTQGGETGAEPAVSNEVTPESTGLLSLPPLRLTVAKSNAL